MEKNRPRELVLPLHIFCTLEDVNIDCEGNLEIVLSKRSKGYVRAIVSALRQGKDMEFCVTFREGDWNRDGYVDRSSY